MKVLLLFVDVNSYHHNDYHFGLGYISSYIKTDGHDVQLMVIHSQSEYPDIIAKIKEFRPGAVGMAAVETQFHYVKEISALIKGSFDLPVVCGGTYTTLYPEALRESPDLDGVFVGESEQAFLEFVNRVEKGEDLRDTPNFAWYDKQTDKVTVNDLLPLVKDLDELPFPDREVFDYQEIIDRMGYAYFLFNRGCPYQCAYCANHALAKTYGKVSNSLRFRSVENCIAEIREVLTKYNVPSKKVYIGDDIFTSNKKWLYSFLEAFKTEFSDYTFFCCTRSNLASDEMFARLKDAGCFRVMMSIESGNDFIRNEIMNRNLSREKIEESFQLAEKYGIETNGMSIIGLPFETREMVMDTIKLVGKCNVTAHGANVFYPYQGTKLRAICEENNMIPSDTNLTVAERKESLLVNNTISKEEITFFIDNWQKLVNQFRPYYPKWRYPRFWLLEGVRNSNLYINCFRDNELLRKIKSTAVVQKFLRL